MSAVDTTAERPGFAEFRSGGVFSTAVADAYAGTYGGAYNAVARKLGLIAPIETTDRMERGIRWETKLADLTHAATGLYVHGEQLWCRHRDLPHHRAIVDGFLHELPEVTFDDLDTLVQFKTTGIDTRLPWDRTLANCMWEIHCTGALRSLLVHAVIDDTTDTLVSIRFTWIERDDFLIGTLVELAEMMWRHIQAGTLPDPDTASALDAVKEVNALADPGALPVVLDDMADEVARFHEIKAAEKSVKDERIRIEARLRERLGRATKGTAPGFVVSVSKPQAIRTPEGNAAFLAAHPEMAKPIEIDSKRAEAEFPAEYAAIPREHIGSRSITVKETKK